MTELLRGIVEWARENSVSPLVAAWLVAGWLGIRLLTLLGHAVSKAATSMWSRYAELLTKVEKELTETRRELAVARAERSDMARELERAEAMNELLTDQLRRSRLKLVRYEGDDE